MLATTNTDRFEKMCGLLFKIRPEIEFVGSTVEEPLENGKCGLDNAIIKAKHYSLNQEIPVLAFDNEIYFDHWTGIPQPGHLIHSFNKKIGSKEDIYNFWENKIINGVTSGCLIKHFALCAKKEIFFTTVSVPFRLALEAGKKSIPKDNILNVFMVPAGFKHSFAELSDKERDMYDEKYFQTALRNILNQL